MSTATATETKTKIKKPSLYKVIMLNDDFTPIDFVMSVLTEIYGKTAQEAHGIANNIHSKGHDVIGVYTHEVARQKVMDTRKLASHYGHPLDCRLEQA